MNVSATNESNTTVNAVDRAARPVLRLVIDRYDQWSDAGVALTSRSGVRPVRPRQCGICVVDHTDWFEAAA